MQLESVGALHLDTPNAGILSTCLVGTPSLRYGFVRCLLNENYVGCFSSSDGAASVRGSSFLFALGTDIA